MVPTFTMRSIGQLGARLYPGSIATATPQTFNSPPIRSRAQTASLTLAGRSAQQTHNAQ
jgi:hypothetical protein